MLQGLYAAASGMEASQTQLDAISNDLANVNTPGYQSTIVGFQDLLYSAGGEAATGTSDATGAGAQAAIVGRDETEGSLETTGRSLDVAISGEGFLEVRRNDGSVGLTRNGSLQVNAQGEITNQVGNPLVPPIKLPKGVSTANLHIYANGNVTDGSRTLGKITLVTVPAPDQLQPVGDSTFIATTASGATRKAAGATLQQGALEGSNVNEAAAMSDLINDERSYQMASQAINYQDQMMQIANGIKK